ncbi:MAG: hypothetical protein K6G33_02235 [Ruminococcus sp.]|uniref:hypothetical protein n=1 Tax=Ruminococcus sp. TaxID=41978 RepID=UPI0025CBEAEB|nr:hypothetical protein [Ruminococcus sp.]MCR5599548.1 hypothetical protein [Ruminococcus sp.]
MKVLSYFDLLIAIGIMVLSLYCLKKYNDKQKKWEDFKANAQYHNYSAPSPYTEYRRWKRNNKNITFFITPFMAAIVYIVLRLNGTIGNIFL